MDDVGVDGAIGAMFHHVDAAHLTTFDAAVLGEETQDIALRDLLFLASADIDQRALRFGNAFSANLLRLGGTLLLEVIDGHLGGDEVGQRLVRPDEQVGGARCAVAGGTTIAVRQGLDVGGQVVVHDVCHLGNVQAAGSEVGRRDILYGVGPQADKCLVAQVLRQPSMIEGTLHALFL